MRERVGVRRRIGGGEEAYGAVGGRGTGAGQ